MTTPEPRDARHAGDGISLIIPAHDEEQVLPRLLRAVSDGRLDLQVIVVCNGCSDRTADAARRHPGVTVIELPEPSKYRAMSAGMDAVTNRWVVLVDADVVISAEDVRRLVEPLAAGAALASGPRRVIDRTGISRIVACYYDVWELLPQVRSGLFGRGVIALSPAAVAAFRALPGAMSDDLVLSECFAPDQRIVLADATVRIVPPRAARDLLRRRVRVATGNAQADRDLLRSPGSRTTLRSLLSVMRASPMMAPKVVVFVGVTIAARIAARRRIRSGDVTTWLRDDSSRSSPPAQDPRRRRPLRMRAGGARPPVAR